MKTASMKPEVALLDNDELTGVEVKVKDFKALTQNFAAHSQY